MNILIKKNELFKNPEHLPLNELYLTVKDIKSYEIHNSGGKFGNAKFPAIHEIFINKQIFPQYLAYYWNPETNETNTEIFLESCQKYTDALDFHLQLSYHQFWCYVVKNPSTVLMLNSFLSDFSPSIDLNLMDNECIHVITQLMHKVGAIIGRLFTYKQSNIEYMAPAVVLQYLEDCGFLTFDKVLNICVLYQEMCPALVTEIANLYFKIKNTSEWSAKVDSFLGLALLVLEATKDAVSSQREEAMMESLGLLSPQVDLCKCNDIISLVLGTLTTLQALLVYCPALQKNRLKSAVVQLPLFYESVLPSLYKILKHKPNDERDKAVERIFQQIVTTRKLCIDIFHLLVNYYVDGITMSDSLEDQAAMVEQYLNMINGLLENDLFLFDYNTSYDIEAQFDIVRVYYSELDPTQTDYILQCLNNLPKLNEITRKKQQALDRIKAVTTNSAAASTSETPSAPLSAEERVQIVANIFPDFPPECIEECLAFCHNDCNAAIGLIMENNLPPYIVDMQRTGVLIPPEPAPAPPLRAYRGKQPRAADAKEMLDDKSDRQLKELILKAVDMRQDMYDDEFDDRLEYEPLRAPLNLNGSRSSEDEDESDEEPDARTVNRRPGQQAGASRSTEAASGFRAFCEDPAKLREQREMAKSSHGRGRGSGAPRDVVGKPKGQGQDEQVTRNRNKKNVNKASKGNHNRKQGAQWKASRGMF